MKKTHFSFILCFLILLPLHAQTVWDGTSVASSFSEGEGTSFNPFIISGPEELAYFANYVNAGNECKNTYFKLNSDIDLGRKPWIPIGKDKISAPFGGNFDGDGHVIYNLNIDNPAGCTDYGLFGYVSNDTIQNLGIGGHSTITTNAANASAGSFAGKMFAPSGGKAAAIINCFSNATVISVTGTVGGIVGNTYGYGGQVRILNCYSTGDLAGNVVGGIAGATGSKDKISISNCYTTGMVTGIKSSMGIASHTNAGVISKSYFVNGDLNSNATTDQSVKTSIEQIKNSSFLSLINDGLQSVAYKSDFTDLNLNDRMPLLMWQQKPNISFDKQSITINTLINLKKSSELLISTGFSSSLNDFECKLKSGQKFSISRITSAESNQLKIELDFNTADQGSFKDSLIVSIISRSASLIIPLEGNAYESAYLIYSTNKLDILANEGESNSVEFKLSGSFLQNNVKLSVPSSVASHFSFDKSEFTPQEVDAGVTVAITFDGSTEMQTQIIASSQNDNGSLIEKRLTLNAFVVPAPIFIEAVITTIYDDYAVARIASDSITTAYYLLTTENTTYTANNIRQSADHNCVMLSSPYLAEIIMIENLVKNKQYYLNIALEKGPNVKKISFMGGQPTSIKSQTDLGVKIYSNGKDIKIETADNNEKQINIYSITGICHKSINTQSPLTNISMYESGIYIVVVKLNNQIITQKVSIW